MAFAKSSNFNILLRKRKFGKYRLPNGARWCKIDKDVKKERKALAKQRSRRRKAIIKRRIFLSLCALVLVCAAALCAFGVKTILRSSKPDDPDNPQSGNSSTASVEEEKESFASVLSTGDIMVHSTQLDGAKVSGDEYDFSSYFKEASAYFKKYDLAIANLEVTFGGKEAGAYSGFPAFNTPDSLADEIKASGLNFLVTANNHCYDTGLSGLKRTAAVLGQKNIEFIGTREDESKPLYTVKEVNGIKIGMANYTYETDGSLSGRKYLNGALIAEEANGLVASFSYKNIDKFYNEAQTVIDNMKRDGAEFIVFYMHWGTEYRLEADTWQKTVAQKLSNMGVDIIVGSHPHVIEPIELIYSEDGTKTTVCIYSLGNAISNQRQELMDSCPSGHTEDGMFFTYKLRKYKGEVTLEEVNVIPTWVNKYKNGGSGYDYTIYPLESADWGSKYGLNSTALSKSEKSYKRTEALVAKGLTDVQREIGCDITFK